MACLQLLGFGLVIAETNLSLLETLSQQRSPRHSPDGAESLGRQCGCTAKMLDLAVAAMVEKEDRRKAILDARECPPSVKNHSYTHSFIYSVPVHPNLLLPCGCKGYPACVRALRATNLERLLSRKDFLQPFWAYLEDTRRFSEGNGRGDEAAFRGGRSMNERLTD